jgi:hypothetical protein
MFSFRRTEPAVARVVEPQLFREAMNSPAVARDLFLPLDQAWWDGGAFTLGRWVKLASRPTTRGVRLQEPGPESAGPPAERDTQGDLSTLVSSVAELRRVPALAGVVLSEETLVGEQKGALPGKRILFGLSCPTGGRFQGETPAAAECHRVLRKSVTRAGFIFEHPKQPFNPTTGFAGLRDWALAVRLRRKKSKRPWLALLLLPLLFFPVNCARNWLSQRNNPSKTGDELAKALQKGGDNAAEGDGSGKSPPGAGGKGDGNGSGGPGAAPGKGGGPGGGPGSGGAGAGNKGAGNGAPNPQPPNRPFASPRQAEEAGPSTTIPSKMGRGNQQLPAVQSASQPPQSRSFGPGSTKHYEAD